MSVAAHCPGFSKEDVERYRTLLGVSTVVAGSTAVLTSPLRHVVNPVNHNKIHGLSGVAAGSTTRSRTVRTAATSGVEANLEAEC